MDNEQQIIDFIDVIYKRRYKRETFHHLFDALDNLAKGLSLEGKRTFTINARQYLGKLAQELQETENAVVEGLPAALSSREQLLKASFNTPTEGAGYPRSSSPLTSASSPLPFETADDAYRDTWDAPPADEAASREDEKRRISDIELDSWGAAPPEAPADEQHFEADIDATDIIEDEGKRTSDATLSPPFSVPDSPRAPTATTEEERDVMKLHEEVLAFLGGEEVETDSSESRRQTRIGRAQLAKPVPKQRDKEADTVSDEDSV